MGLIFEIDARLLNNSGIGRYIGEVLKRLNRRFTAKGRIRLSNGLDSIFLCNIICDKSTIYGIKEQFSRVDSKIPIRWTPHYNFPVISGGIQLVTVHDLAHLALPQIFSPLQRFYAFIMLALGALMANHIFFVSEFTCHEFKRILGGMPESWSIVHCGVDVEYWACLGEGVAESPPYFLAVGNVKPHKNLRNVLRAFHLVRVTNPNIRLKIVGKLNGFKVGDAAFLAEIKGGANGVELLGVVSDDELRKLYRGATGLVFPSLYEGFGLPPLEAMAAGCPSVVSTTGALESICSDGLGIFCDPNDVHSIAAGIAKLLTWTDADRLKWRSRSIQRLKQFAWEKAAESIWSVMEYHGKESIV